MFQLREEHMQALRASMVKQFVNRMVLHLQAIYPEETPVPSGDALKERIHTGIEAAARYEITLECDVRRYLESAVLHGWDFDSQCAWAREILCDESLDPEAKVATLERYVPET